MERVYDLENPKDLQDWDNEIAGMKELLNSYKTITIESTKKELIGIVVKTDQNVTFDAGQYPNGDKLLNEWKGFVADGKVSCEITEKSDLMVEMHFKAGQKIFAQNEGMMTWLLENVSGYSLIYGIPVVSIDEYKVDDLVNEVIKFEKDGKVSAKDLIDATPLSITTAGLVNIPTKYHGAYAQARVVASYLKGLSFMKVVPTDLILRAIDKLFKMGVLEFKDGDRDEFMTWLKAHI